MMCDTFCQWLFVKYMRKTLIKHNSFSFGKFPWILLNCEPKKCEGFQIDQCTFLCKFYCYNLQGNQLVLHFQCNGLKLNDGYVLKTYHQLSSKTTRFCKIMKRTKGPNQWKVVLILIVLSDCRCFCSLYQQNFKKTAQLMIFRNSPSKFQ